MVSPCNFVFTRIDYVDYNIIKLHLQAMFRFFLQTLSCIMFYSKKIDNLQQLFIFIGKLTSNFKCARGM